MPSDHKMSRWLYVLTFLFASRAPLPCAGFVLRPSCCSRTTSTAATVMASPQNFEVTPDLAKKTAALAQIQISDEEVDVLVPRMEEFLGFVETMEEVSQSSDGAFATLNCGSDFLREDYAEKFSNVAAVMDNMPVEENNYLRVPKVGEDEG